MSQFKFNKAFFCRWKVIKEDSCSALTLHLVFVTITPKLIWTISKRIEARSSKQQIHREKVNIEKLGYIFLNPSNENHSSETSHGYRNPLMEHKLSRHWPSYIFVVDCQQRHSNWLWWWPLTMAEEKSSSGWSWKLLFWRESKNIKRPERPTW